MFSAMIGQALGIRRNGAEHDVGMAADIFGAGLHADVDATLQRTVKQRRRPGIVVDHERAAFMGHRRDGGNIGHLEGLRARRLDQHGAGVRLEQRADACADQRIEIGGLDAIASQHAVAEIARRPVGVVANQQMVAGLGHREQGGGDRRQGPMAPAPRRRIAGLRGPSARPAAPGWSGCRGGRTGTRSGGRENPLPSDTARWNRGKPAD